jgi:hypothetical protein
MQFHLFCNGTVSDNGSAFSTTDRKEQGNKRHVN